MKLYKYTIKPTSSFGTPLKGDTLFGQLCWAVRYLYGEETLTALLKEYATDPFLIVSDAFPTGYLPKPKMPSSYLKEDTKQKKENRKKVWLTQQELQNGEYNLARKDKDIALLDKQSTTIHNALNYLTFHTGDGDGFDPYGTDEYILGEKDIYFAIDENRFDNNKLKKSVGFIATLGYGKDTTIGKGRFEIINITETEIDTTQSTSYMTLSPFSPKGQKFEKIFYDPFVRFGKHGYEKAHQKAFKKPLLLADSTSVVKLSHSLSPKKPYIGKALENISDSHPETKHQGYSIVIPIKELT